MAHSISQEPYIIRFLFLVHMYKVIISAGVFFHFFKTFVFWVVRENEKAKKGPKCQKNLPAMIHISGTIHHIIVIYGAHL